MGGTHYTQYLDPGTYKFVVRLYFKCDESDDLPCFTKDLESNEVEVSEEDTKSTTVTTRENANGYKYTMGGDVSGPISITFTRDNTASLHVKIGDKIAYFTGWAHVIKKGDSEDILSQCWMSEIKTGEVTNSSENNATVNGIEIPRDHILKILNHEEEFAKVDLPTDNVVGIKLSETWSYAINWKDYFDYNIYEKNDGYFCEFNNSRISDGKPIIITTGNYSLGKEEIELAIARINKILSSEFIKVYTGECTESQKLLTRGGNEMGDLYSWELEVSYKDGTSVVFDYLNGISSKKLGEVTKYCVEDVKDSRRAFKMRIDDDLKDKIIRNATIIRLEDSHI